MSRLILAPMEGLADDVLRSVLTQTGGYDWCVSEFIRIADTRLPQGAFTRVSPELKNGSRTASGTPVRVQLLGSDPNMMARNAAHLARLNPVGIDLNFGCPAPLVNKHGGGAALLGDPAILEAITAAVRQAVPAAIPVTTKMRLGINDTERTLDCARALEAGGAAEITVHARTKADGYRPPARWEWIARIREATALPLIANGEVWTLADYRDIRIVTGCEDVMLGRGAVADPLLAHHIRLGTNEDERDWDADWQAICGLIADFWQRVQIKLEPRHAPGRFKQWLGLMRRTYPQAEALYQQVRATRMADEVTRILPHHGISVAPPARQAA